MWIFNTIIAATMSLGLAFAQDNYLEAYQEFQTAYAAGDLQMATDKAKLAYQLAEDGEATDDEVAILAENYLQLTMWTDPETALPIVEKLETLKQSGVSAGKLSFSELVLIKVYLQHKIGPKIRSVLREFQKESEIAYAEGKIPTILRMRTSLELATSLAHR